MANNTSPNEEFALGYTNPGATGLNKQNIANNTISNLNLQNSINTQGSLAQMGVQQQMPQQQLPTRPTKPNTQSNNFIPQESVPPQAQVQPHEVGTDAQGKPTLNGQPFIEEEAPEQINSDSSIKPLAGDIYNTPFKSKEIPQGQEVLGSADKNAYSAFSAQFKDIDDYLNAGPSSEEDKELFSQFSNYTLKTLKDDIGQKSFNNNRSIPKGFNLKNHLRGILNFAKISGKDPDAIASDFNGLLFVAGNNDKNTAADQINYFELTGTSLGAASEEFKNYSAQVMKKVNEGVISEQDALDLIDAKKQKLSEKEGFADAFWSKGESNREVRYSILGDAVFGALGMAVKPLGKAAGKALNKPIKIGKDWIDKHPGIVREAIDKLHLSKPVAKVTNEKVQKFADNKIFESAVASGNYNPVDNEVYDFMSKINNKVDYNNLVDNVMKKKNITESEAISLLDKLAEKYPDKEFAKTVRRGKYAANIDREMAEMYIQADDRTLSYLSDELRAMNKEGLADSLTPDEFNKTLSRRIYEKALKNKLPEVEASKIAEEGSTLNSLYDKYFADPKNLKELEMEMYQGVKELDVNDPAEAKARVDFWLESIRDRKMSSVQKGEAFGREFRYRKDSKEKVDPSLKGAATSVGGELGKELGDLFSTPGTSSSIKKPREVTEAEIDLDSLGNGDDSYIPYRGPELDEPLTWEGHEDYRDVYDTLKNDIKAAEDKGQITPEEADALEKRAVTYNSLIRSIQSAPLNDIPKLIAKVEKAQGKVNDYSNAGMPKTWIGAYLSGEFGDPKSKDAKRTLAYFALNSLGTALMNSSAVIQKRATTDTEWDKAQGVRLNQAYTRYDKAKTKAFENNLDSIAKAMNMSLDQKNKVADLMNEGDIRLLYDKLGDTRKLQLLEKVARFAPYYNKLSDSQKAAMAAIMIDSGLTPRDELSLLSANFSKKQIAELLGGMKNAEYLNKMYNSHVTQKQVELVSSQIQQAIQSARLTEAEANLYAIKVYAELADKGVTAAMNLLNSLLPGGNK